MHFQVPPGGRQAQSACHFNIPRARYRCYCRGPRARRASCPNADTCRRCARDIKCTRTGVPDANLPSSRVRPICIFFSHPCFLFFLVLLALSDPYGAYYGEVQRLQRHFVIRGRAARAVVELYLWTRLASQTTAYLARSATLYSDRDKGISRAAGPPKSHEEKTRRSSLAYLTRELCIEHFANKTGPAKWLTRHFAITRSGTRGASFLSA